MARQIGLKIMHRRNTLGFSRQRLGDILELPPQSVERYENGRRLPSVINLRRFAGALQCTVRDLLPEGL